MNSIIALEELVRINKERVKHHEKQIADHESGESKLSRLALASAEGNLEEALEELEKYQTMLDSLSTEEKRALEEKERLEKAIERKKYFDNQISRINKMHSKSEGEKLEAMLIIDELPNGVEFEDEKIFNIVEKSLELEITQHKEVHEKLQEVKKRFEQLLEKSQKGQIQELSILKYEIPIVVVQFSIFSESILQSIEKINTSRQDALSNEDQDGVEYEEISFKGFPKYEDWWVHELWKSHQAYFALYKWKKIISSLCLTPIQKSTWEAIFDSWMTIKRLLDDKGEIAYELQYIFDTLLYEYVGLEEELEKNNLLSMESIIKKITSKEDFTTVSQSHSVVTPYLKFKRAKQMKGKEEDKVDEN